jgi:hypothetical protein
VNPADPEVTVDADRTELLFVLADLDPPLSQSFANKSSSSFYPLLVDPFVPVAMHKALQVEQSSLSRRLLRHNVAP